MLVAEDELLVPYVELVEEDDLSLSDGGCPGGGPPLAKVFLNTSFNSVA
jgi:hypothetical protein